jgi:hypothetical protein
MFTNEIIEKVRFGDRLTEGRRVPERVWKK